MSQYDFMKLFEQFDEEISEGDFTAEELEEYLHDYESAEKLGGLDSEGTQRGKVLSPSEWKKRYFEYYDDIKDKSLKKQDW